MGYGELEATSDGNRYKVITVGDKYYYIDLDHNPLFPLFPFLVFFLPVKGYELKNLSNINIIYHEKNSGMLISGLGLAFSRFLRRMSDYTTVYLVDYTKFSILIIAMIVTLCIRYFFQRKNKREQEVKSILVWIRPQSRNRFILVMIFLITVYGALILSMYFFWIENGLDILFLTVCCLLFYFATNFNSLLIKSGKYKVKIKRSC